MTTQATKTAPSGDALAQVNEILNTPLEQDETLAGHDEDADDYVPNTDNSNDADDDQDENLDDEAVDEEDDEAGDEEEQETDEEDSDEEEDESGESDIENISELAKHLDADEGAIYSLEVPMGDGLEPVSISALKDSYMERERDQKQFAENQVKFDEAVRYHQAQWADNQKLPELNDQVIAAATNVRAIEQADANFDWEALEAADPTQALLQKQKLNEALKIAKEDHQSAVSKVTDQRNKAFTDMKAYERGQTLDKIPEWKDPKVYQKDADRMGPLLAEYGFSPQEVQNVYDHRLTQVIRDFMLLKETAGKANLTKKKLRITKKRLSSSNTETVKVGKKVALNKKLNHAKDSKDDRVKASAIADLLS